MGLDTVKYYVRRLRRSLERNPCGLRLITVRGVGYKLVATDVVGTGNGRTVKKLLRRAGQAGAA